MKFGKEIQRQQIPGWSPYYLDYKALKKIIAAANKSLAESNSLLIERLPLQAPSRLGMPTLHLFLSPLLGGMKSVALNFNEAKQCSSSSWSANSKRSTRFISRKKRNLSYALVTFCRRDG
ncbi:uncharacterized protein EI90DRAFT_1297442 [Cantharellus anzutake]|uniref:uncharacterized protein n=1 Tax=Cantharellus anzutake TaxID=1750568 RepID=UPI001906C90E|nr:uncharacterized protein EI90DRAFT_1297442 [Cantharellus anzutake]KAF8342029.1 hypothetical protein EI90DRAFT_1297442 [Cantharellus anzutake]